MIRNNLLATLLCISALTAFASDSTAERDASTSTRPLETIPALDVARYMGTWYEIAKYPNWFQKKCSGNVKADYSLMNDGRVRVVNRCQTAESTLSEAIGEARQIGPSTSPKLEVRFAPAWLSFLPFVWGDYWVVELDDDYQLVAVSEPDRDYLWILSRTPEVDPVSYNALLTRLQRQGFDLQRMEATKQD
ncbi:Outer membrane lipoprotein Blc [bioreactor metagenome]|uniref:Outer membrane lipoprotein Blc n=1 Tax=bioreactor metagenome TaxID=1076179 RepID=A0A645CSL9_9ZZZZ